ncbi:YwmB family TATA-box binding protein [Staphylospora marina]|uniref:YwmB family TATA-box binding protein n=1 Tax=Staphylospora marina TaxID=2490858 RepID=UPI000F5C1846|nr:YwmB family TATA-box binding protein [Staphylospora marina]
MKRTIRFFLVLLFLFVTATGSGFSEPEDRLLRMLQAEGAHVEKVVLHHGQRTSSPLSLAESRRLAEELARAFGLGRLSEKRNPDGVVFTAERAEASGIRTGVTLIHDAASDRKIRPYVSVRVTSGGGSPAALERRKRRVSKVLHSFGIMPQYHVNVQGSKPAAGSDARLEVRRLLEKADAREVEAMLSGQTVSVSAYASPFPEGLRTAGGIMNLQIAARLNHHENRLVLTLGTPIITIEY